MPSFVGLTPASVVASRIASSSSKKTGTQIEKVLARELRRRGLRFKTNALSLPGRPDLVFAKEKVVVFCDGDFWHGRRLQERLRKLADGHNAPYWIAKIESNVRRDRRNTRLLRDDGWRVIRLWESLIRNAPHLAAKRVEACVRRRP